MEMHLSVMCLVPDDAGRYLCIEEHDRSWFFPAGGVEPGENLMAAAVRETAEEAGVMIGLRGILSIDHRWFGERGFVRVCFVGYQAIAGPPKSRHDEHSRRAAWLTRAELEKKPLRADAVLEIIDRYETAPQLLPCRAYEWRGPDGPGFSARLG
jgi:phosphatase NudJ